MSFNPAARPEGMNIPGEAVMIAQEGVEFHANVPGE
jgi:hypothetical protein